jgi:hypothetical protein
MLASFNADDEVVNNDEFDATLHMQSISKIGRMKVHKNTQFRYKQGWTHIVEQLILEIRKYPIELHLIVTDFGSLEVFFECYERTHEVRVWRAINKAQLNAQSTCMFCGESGVRKVKGDKLVVICGYCFRKAEVNGDTGTWLDRY